MCKHFAYQTLLIYIIFCACVSIDSPKPDSKQSLKLNLLFLQVLVDSPLALPQAGAYFRYTSVILGMSHYLDVTPIFVFCGHKWKEFIAKKNTTKQTLVMTTQEGEITNQTGRRTKQKQTIISQLKRDKNKIKLEKVWWKMWPSHFESSTICCLHQEDMAY